MLFGVFWVRKSKACKGLRVSLPLHVVKNVLFPYNNGRSSLFFLLLLTHSMVRRSIYTILVSLMAVSGFAQNELYDEPVVLYSKQHYGGINLNSRGYGAFFTYGKYKDASHINQITFDFNFIKHEKERKFYFPDQNAKGYFYGKQNSFMTLRVGWGKKRIITEKLRKNGVQVGYNWILGGDIGMLKPVYLEILHMYEGSNGSYYLEVEKFDPDKHFTDNIYGRASSLRGLGEMKIVPGLFFRSAFNFEFSNYKDALKGIELGASVDVFPYRVPIMAPQILEEREDGATNHQFFLSLYLHLFIGKKYNNQ